MGNKTITSYLPRRYERQLKHGIEILGQMFTDSCDRVEEKTHLPIEEYKQRIEYLTQQFNCSAESLMASYIKFEVEPGEEKLKLVYTEFGAPHWRLCK